MAMARKQVELAVRIDSRRGDLGRVLQTVADQGINVLAYCSYADHTGTMALLVVPDPLRAKAALESAGFKCRANNVVVVGARDSIGAAALIGAQLGDAGIDILYSYASASGGDDFSAVFKTIDDERAIRILESGSSAAAAA